MPVSNDEQGTLSLSPGVPIQHGAPDQQGGAGTAPRIRALAVPFKKTTTIQLEDGDLLIKGVPMLAEGTWTDSAVGTPLFYPARTLQEYAGNWVDTSGWIRHLGGVPRKSTDKVGEAENIRYELGAVTADVRVYGFTQTGRDLQELIKRKLISFVSVEHGGDEKYNPATRQMEASTLTFHGFAFVNKGACKLCRINESYPWDQCITDQMKKGYDEETARKICGSIKARNNSEEEASMEPKELESKLKELSDAKENVSKLQADLKALSDDKAKQDGYLKELEAKNKELAEISARSEAALKDLAAKVKELAEKPAPKTAATSERELEVPKLRVHVDRKTGEVYPV